MKFSRRHFSLLFPALALAEAAPQTPVLPSKASRYENLPVSLHGANKTRIMLDGETHTGFAIELHETELAPGEAPHPPHQHVNEEVFLVREGTLEVTIIGRTVNLDPGSVAYVASNERHGVRNVGKTPARYFLFALGPDWDYRQRAENGFQD